MELADKEMEFLHTRQLLKEAIRKKMKENLDTCNINVIKKKLPYDCFGSFFGPSEPAIAKRVIEESKLVEFQTKATRLINYKLHAKKSSNVMVRSKDYKPVLTHNQLQNKAKMLKYSRDYSFLNSNDSAAEIPNILPPKDPQTPQVKSRSKETISDTKKSESARDKQASTVKHQADHHDIDDNNNKHLGNKRKYNDQSNKEKQSFAKKQKRSQPKQYYSYPQLNVDVSSIIRKIFRYDPTKYRGNDEYENDYAMVSNFADIQKEERRSERIGKKEDKIELQRMKQLEVKQKSKLKEGKKGSRAIN